MGRYAAQTAAALDFVEELVVGDLDGGAADDIAARLGPKASGAAVDVQNDRALSKLFAGATAVLNTVGPFFRLGPPVLRAAITAGVHYLDINDDWESTEAMLALDDDARSAGVTAVIGVGASPGISNMLACLAMRELDDVDEVIAGFDLDAAMPEQRGDKPCAATVHALHQLSGRIRVFEDGAFAEAKPQCRVEFDYPGLGPRTGWTMGHPEAVTFPRTFPKLRTARVLMTMAPSGRIAARGLSCFDRRRCAFAPREPGDGSNASKASASRSRRPPTTSLRYSTPLQADCRRSLQLPKASAGASQRLSPRLFAPLPRSAWAAQRESHSRLASASFAPILGSKCGVFPPEAIIDPNAFFDALAPLCDPVCTDTADLTVVTRSWEPVDLGAALAAR